MYHRNSLWMSFSIHLTRFSLLTRDITLASLYIPCQVLRFFFFSFRWLCPSDAFSLLVSFDLHTLVVALSLDRWTEKKRHLHFSNLTFFLHFLHTVTWPKMSSWSTPLTESLLASLDIVEITAVTAPFCPSRGLWKSVVRVQHSSSQVVSSITWKRFTDAHVRVKEVEYNSTYHEYYLEWNHLNHTLYKSHSKREAE